MRSVYREAALGASLKAALEGLVREEHLTPNLIEETMAAMQATTFIAKERHVQAAV